MLSDTERKEHKQKSKRKYRLAHLGKARADTLAWQKTHPEKARAIARAWRKAHVEKERIRKETYRKTHLEKVRATTRVYQKTHSEKIRMQNRMWTKSRPELSRAKTQRYRTRKLNLPNTLTASEFVTICKSYGYKCVYCDKQLTPKTVTMDHKVPLSKGGGTTKENIVPACLSCNDKKGTKIWQF